MTGPRSPTDDAMSLSQSLHDNDDDDDDGKSAGITEPRLLTLLAARRREDLCKAKAV